MKRIGEQNKGKTGNCEIRLCTEGATLETIRSIGCPENKTLGKEMGLLFGVVPSCTPGSEKAARRVQFVYAGEKPYREQAVSAVMDGRGIWHRLHAEAEGRFIIGTDSALSMDEMKAAGVVPYGRKGREALFREWLTGKVEQNETFVFGVHRKTVAEKEGEPSVSETMKIWGPSTREGIAYQYSRIQKGIGPTGHQDITSVDSWVMRDILLDMSSHKQKTLTAEEVDEVMMGWVAGFQDAALKV